MDSAELWRRVGGRHGCCFCILYRGRKLFPFLHG
jgi:hypothetical protein